MTRGQLRCVAAIGSLAFAVALAFAATAGGGRGLPAERATARPAPPAGAAAERRLRTVEERMLGAVHAAEHAALRARARLPEAAAAAVGDPAADLRAAVSAEPAEVGRWLPKFSIPGVAVHAVMLRTGKVLYFTGTTQGRAFLLDPVTQTTKAVYPPKVPGGQDEPANIFCAGQSFLPDGTVVIMGGTVDRREGLNTIFTFDPVTETWQQRPNMQHGRWYPTQVLLADGRTVVMDGLDERGEPNVNPQIETFSPDPDSVTLLGTRGQPGEPPSGGLYPHLFQMPSGRVLVAGPEPRDSWFLTAGAGAAGGLSWEDAPDPVRHTFGSGVLLPQGPAGSTRVALIGGVDRDALPDTGTSTPLPVVETFDEANPQAGWTSAPPLNYGRAHHNTVQLPDLSMVTVGGGYGILDGNRRAGDAAIHRNIELYDPATGAWRLGPAQDELRTYHSTALLLPDARVLSAGDDGYGGSQNDTAEIYEPPYLFKGPRPAIVSAPGEIEHGQTFDVETAGDATQGVLVAPAAVTHANDMSQRVVPLAAGTATGGKLTLTAPPSAAVAPPTWYMLFVLRDGVPSVAKFVRLKPGPADPPPDTSITHGPAGDTQATSAQFEFLSTKPGSSFRCRLDGGSEGPCASPVTYNGLAEGPHSFSVTAVDATGKPDPTPATRSWTVLPATVPDTTAPDTTITYGPSEPTSATGAVFEFTSSEPGSTYTCRIEIALWTSCDSPVVQSGLALGRHIFRVRATDPAGNTDRTPARWIWNVVPEPLADSPTPGLPAGSAPPLAPLAAVDSKGPRLTVRVRRLRGRRLVLVVGCPSESCAAVARGRVRLARRTRRFGPVSSRIDKGRRARFTLRLPRQAVRAARRARVRLTITARDAAGNSTTVRRTVALRR